MEKLEFSSNQLERAFLTLNKEIPFQVPDEVLKTISETMLEYGLYPIINHHGT